MKKLELVFIPLSGLGHLTAATECARHLLDQDERLSIIVLVILPPSSKTYTKSHRPSDARIKYTTIPTANPPSQSSSSFSLEKLTNLFIEWHKYHVERAVMELSTGSIEIKNWLDKQPSKSVLFLCFGSRGTFKQPQAEQIAIALEKSGHRFLWSIRQPPKHKFEAPTDYTSYENVLPDGFLARVKERGMVCGWVPQVEVLAHAAIKGFVNHCGWNSILDRESHQLLDGRY
ncbi:hypothetical protein L2E82_15360 [Cichorium intybus]|uniref:Uncharacterized protein n=1 Tax=Cichorium intybus TaxID=13427 RepID=A0ACB9F2L4_CICIN|nr:hypothetical protein L2E82_15360 [Cichorium intybus]